MRRPAKKKQRYSDVENLVCHHRALELGTVVSIAGSGTGINSYDSDGRSATSCVDPCSLNAKRHEPILPRRTIAVLRGKDLDLRECRLVPAPA